MKREFNSLELLCYYLITLAGRPYKSVPHYLYHQGQAILVVSRDPIELYSMIREPTNLGSMECTSCASESSPPSTTYAVERSTPQMEHVGHSEGTQLTDDVIQ
jgi:hypothetical protein